MKLLACAISICLYEIEYKFIYFLNIIYYTPLAYTFHITIEDIKMYFIKLIFSMSLTYFLDLIVLTTISFFNTNSKLKYVKTIINLSVLMLRQPCRIKIQIKVIYYYSSDKLLRLVAILLQVMYMSVTNHGN